MAAGTEVGECEKLNLANNKVKWAREEPVSHAGCLHVQLHRPPSESEMPLEFTMQLA